MKEPMTRPKLLAWFVLTTVAGVALFMTWNHAVELSDEREVYSEVEMSGTDWRVIKSEDMRIDLMNRYGITIPENDFERSYLLLSLGRRIIRLKYRLISRYLWDLPHPKGDEVFDQTLYPHSLFVYKMSRIYLEQDL